MCRRGVVGDGAFLKHLCHGRNFIEEIYIDSVNKYDKRCFFFFSVYKNKHFALFSAYY